MHATAPDSTEFRKRRRFLTQSGVILAAGATGHLLLADETPAKSEDKKDEKPAEEVSPPEDLMREHGVLKRILLIYGEALRRMDSREDLPPEPIQQSAKLIRSFVEDYHEKLEEDYLFPRFKKACKLVGLVEVLNQQHQAGRKLTDITLRFATVQ